MGLGKLGFLDTEIDLDQIFAEVSAFSLKATVQYDPEVAHLPDLVARVSSFGFVMLLAVCVSLAVSDADIRQAPPKTALTFACCALVVPATYYVPFHTFCFQGTDMWKALLSGIWLIVAPWLLMRYAVQAKDLVIQGKAGSGDAAAAGTPGTAAAGKKTKKKQ